MSEGQGAAPYPFVGRSQDGRCLEFQQAAMGSANCQQQEDERIVAESAGKSKGVAEGMLRPVGPT
ncbi:MAG: hypothetical protein KJZ93_31340 [Caldilineaceae bacterium]|nr:hypothetical protein [Caldilineaceae bacterium]